MGLFRLSPEKMQQDIAGLLEPDEVVVASAFGVKVPAKETSRKILIFGLVIFGLLILQMMQDKVYLVLTNKRLLVVVLMERSYSVIGHKAYGLDQIENATLEIGSMYHNVELTAAGSPLRIKFFPSPMGLNGNGDEVKKIGDSLKATTV